MEEEIVEEIVKEYELLLILVPNLPEKDLKTELDEIRGFLQKNTRGIFHEDVWGLKELAYQIKTFQQGYYVIFYFNAMPSQIAEIKNAVRINPKLIRNLLVILPLGYEIKKYEFEVEEKPKEAPKKAPLAKGMEEKAEEVVAEIEKKTVEEPLLKGKTEKEKLESVEKTLEDILENPDIKLK